MMYNNGYVGFKLFRLVIVVLIALGLDVALIGLYFNKDKVVDIYKDFINSNITDEIEEEDVADTWHQDETCRVSVYYYLENVEYTMALSDNELDKVNKYLLNALNGNYYNVPNDIEHYDFKVTTCNGVSYYLDSDSKYVHSAIYNDRRYYLGKNKDLIFDIFGTYLSEHISMYLYDNINSVTKNIDKEDVIKILNVMNDSNMYNYVFDQNPIVGNYKFVFDGIELYFDDITYPYYKYRNNTIDMGYELGTILNKYILK